MLGVFDSGFGGLTVLKPIHDSQPNLSTIYLGDNARAPYGVHDHETIFQYALEGTRTLFSLGCPLVIFACNSASAQALRQIQQEILPKEYPDRRVLGVIRPAAEELSTMSQSGHIGIFGTPATVSSEAYVHELHHINPQLAVSQVASPGITDLIEKGETDTEDMHALVKTYCDQLMSTDPKIDAALLGCTHFPLVEQHFKDHLPKSVRVISQGEIVAQKLIDYLQRHPEMLDRIDRTGKRTYLTTAPLDHINGLATRFYGDPITFEHTEL